MPYKVIFALIFSIYNLITNMKKLFLAALASFAITCASAQSSSPKLSIGPELGVPVGDAGSIYSAVLGASVKLEAPISHNVYFTIATGVNNFIPKSDYNAYLSSATYIPVEGGFKAFFTPNFYFAADLGASFNTNQYYSASKAAFIYAPGLGVFVPVDAKNNGIDFGLRYENRVESNGTISQLAFRAAYRFNL